MSQKLSDKIKESLGLTGKEPRVEPLKDDTADVTDKAASDAALSAELAALESNLDADVQNADSMELAAIELAAFEMTPGAASLLDRAMDSLSKNTGVGLDDPDAVAIAKGRAALIRAAGNSLSVVIDATVEVTPQSEVGGAVYSLLYAVLKNAGFFANLDRNAVKGMDVAADEQIVEDFFVRMVGDRYTTEALGHVAEGVELSGDSREQDREPPSGLESRRERQLAALQAVYGSDDPVDAVVQAYRDLRLFFQLTTEAMGWDPERPMPFTNTQKPDLTFEPIHDAEIALDAIEIKRVASQVKRREVRAQRATAATAAASAILKKALEGKKNHIVR